MQGCQNIKRHGDDWSPPSFARCSKLVFSKYILHPVSTNVLEIQLPCYGIQPSLIFCAHFESLNISPKFCFSNVKSNKIICISKKLLRQCKNKLLRDRSTQISTPWGCSRKDENYFVFVYSYSLSQLFWLKSSHWTEI